MWNLEPRSLVFALAGALLWPGPASAQYWADAGQPLDQWAAHICYNDTVHDWLLVGGEGYLILDGHYYKPLFRYDGLKWDTLGLFGNVVRTAVVYRDTLIVGGGFEWMHEDTLVRIAAYADGAWHPYGDLGPGPVRKLRVVDGELYAMGVFRYADGQFCEGAAKRVGGHWEPLPNWPLMQYGPPYMNDITRFQGRLVVSGVFTTLSPSFRNMMQYDGSAWIPVCNGCASGGFDSAGDLVVYKDNLYMGGAIHFSSTTPGQGVIRWDGQQWYGLSVEAGGIQMYNYSDFYTPVVQRLDVYQDRLFLAGGVRFVNHLPTPGIASWDGTNFCTLAQPELYGDFESSTFTFYHDTLYMSMSPPATLGRGLVRYLGTDYTHECSTLGWEELTGPGTALQVHWSPTQGLSLLGLPAGLHELQVYDAQGRLVLRQPVRSQAGRSEAVAFAPLGSALYIAVVDGQKAGRFILTR
ncbi:MAG TPA: hypothetical protein PKD45_10465 [Flavobacteriales bacterium]|nr:hypothetical protein [Flavobacteriales bacterium]